MCLINNLTMISLSIFCVFLLSVTTANAQCVDKTDACKNYLADYYCTPQFKDYLTLLRFCPLHCGLCTDKCGVPRIASSRIIGGINAKRGAWPWQIALWYNRKFNCGGTIVNNRWLVTAAHCVQGKDVKDFLVSLGETELDVREKEQIFGVSRIIIHPSYGNLNNDIALIQVNGYIRYTQYIQPACLPAMNESPAVGTKCYITGFGKIKHPGGSHPKLQQLPLIVKSYSECLQKNRYFTKQMLCAAKINPNGPNQSGCHGDSGGPFVCQQQDGSWKLHGAVSWGSKTCDSNEKHTVFARIGVFRNWMDQYINA